MVPSTAPIFRVLDPKLAAGLHSVLNAAFITYRPKYTQKAYAATVVSTKRFKERILSGDSEVYCAHINGKLAGTCSLKVKENELYIFSMGVRPEFAGRGIGKAILNLIQERAFDNRCQSIILETYAPLTHAISLYEKFGFERTGRSRDYFGIMIFEMKKKL